MPSKIGILFRKDFDEIKSWPSMFVHPNISTASSLIVRQIDIADNIYSDTRS